MARPTKLTPETQAEIVRRIAGAATFDAACQASGVDYGTFSRWMTKGEKQRSGIYREFRDAVRRAEALCKANMAATIAKAAAEGDWRAAEAYLKRRDRANWGDQIAVTGADGGPVQIVNLGEDVDKL